jgi:hypothetical protein
MVAIGQTGPPGRKPAGGRGPIHGVAYVENGDHVGASTESLPGRTAAGRPRGR